MVLSFELRIPHSALRNLLRSLYLPIIVLIDWAHFFMDDTTVANSRIKI